MLLVSEHDRGEPSEEPHTSLSVEKKHSRDDLFGGAGNASVQGTVSWNDVERESAEHAHRSGVSGRRHRAGAADPSGPQLPAPPQLRGPLLVCRHWASRVVR